MNNNDYYKHKNDTRGTCRDISITNIKELPNSIQDMINRFIRDDIEFNIEDKHIRFRKDNKVLAQGDVLAVGKCITLNTFYINTIDTVLRFSSIKLRDAFDIYKVDKSIDVLIIYKDQGLSYGL